MSDQLAVQDTIDTGLAWIGEIPSHWTVGPFKNLVAIQNGADYKNVEADDGFPVMGSGGPFAYAKNAMYDGETVLLGRKGTIDKPLYYNGPFWAVDTMYWSKISPRANGRFAYYVATTIPFAMYATNTALPSMTKSTLGAHLVAYPSKDEQDHIANWLDLQTSRIDTLIAKKTRFIELLKEKRQAVITKAVTKGLNDSVEMKDSGLFWIGHTPSHWKVGTLKNLLSIRNGADYKHIESDDGYPVIGSGGPFAYCSKSMYEGESVLLGRKGTIDKPLYWIGSFWAVDTMYWSVISEDAEAKFAYYVATTIPFGMYSTNTALPSMTKSTLGSHSITFPDKKEQQEIAKFLDAQTFRFDLLIEKTERSIQLLKEKRSALITAAVTGKIDIRKAL